MTGWQHDQRWADRFVPEVKHVLGFYLIGRADQDEDQLHNTDLVVLKMDSVRVACRIRRNEFLLKYPYEFTIRAGRPSGAKTELAKVIEGWGDYLFYGFADAGENSLAAWFLGDLGVFRGWYSDALIRSNGHPPGRLRFNRDGSSSFHAFELKDMPDSFVIGYSWQT